MGGVVALKGVIHGNVCFMLDEVVYNLCYSRVLVVIFPVNLNWRKSCK